MLLLHGPKHCTPLTLTLLHTPCSATPAFLDLFGPAAAAASSLEGNLAAAGEGSSPGRGYEDALWGRCLAALAAGGEGEGAAHAQLAAVPRGVWADLAQLEV